MMSYLWKLKNVNVTQSMYHYHNTPATPKQINRILCVWHHEPVQRNQKTFKVLMSQRCDAISLYYGAESRITNKNTIRAHYRELGSVPRKISQNGNFTQQLLFGRASLRC